ncbi:MAG: peptidoglycan DD-metalloendopeptidase family protein [Roseburia sp.]
MVKDWINHIEKKVWIQAGITLGFLLLLLYGAIGQFYTLGAHYYSVTVNDCFLGNVSDKVDAEELIHNGRRELADQTDGYLLLDLDYEIQEKRDFFQPLISEEELSGRIRNTITEEYEAQENQVMYLIWAGDEPIYFESMDAVTSFLERIKNQQDTSGNYRVVYESAGNHNENVMHANLVYSDEAEKVQKMLSQPAVLFADAMFVQGKDDSQGDKLSGVLGMSFSKEVKVYTDYLPLDLVSNADIAFKRVTKTGEPNTIYQVQEGDTLASIAEEQMTTVESIMELNGYGSEEEALVEGNQMIIAIPSADIGLRVVKGLSYEENYTVKNEYINNQDWYRNQQVVRSVGTPGRRQVDMVITMDNGVETDHQVVAQIINVAATPTVIERGIRNPDTFIWPLNSPVISSTFGERWGRMHEGVDFACPEGTPVMAALGGTVTYVGWINGYGNCVMIRHDDGTSTRYAHNSELLVEEGQTVVQGEIISLSGNTGNSTGPHLHFEILVDGEPVDPLEYLQ